MTGASPWSVKGIAAEERELAKQAARRAGVPIGQWLSRQIRDAAEQERALRGGGRAPDARFGHGAGAWRPAEPMPSEAAPSPTASAWRSALSAPPPAPDLPHPPPMAYPSPPVTRPPPPAVDPARVRELERRVEEVRDLEDRLAGLEKLERRLGSLAAELAELGARVDGVEQRVEARVQRADSQAAALTREVKSLAGQVEELRSRPPAEGGSGTVTASTAPVERAVMRLAERLQRVEELTLPEDRGGRGLFGRLFRR